MKIGLTVLNDDEIQQQFSSLDEYPLSLIFINCPTDMRADSAVTAQYVRMGAIYFSDFVPHRVCTQPFQAI